VSSEAVVVVKDGQAKLLPLAQAKSFDLYTSEEIVLAEGEIVRITKNFRAGANRFRNNELCTVTAIEGENIVLDDNRVINLQGPLHLDQGIAVTSHAAQAKTVDQVLVSVPVAAFSQANQAQFYVSMSRARRAMHLFTDSKVALKEAVTRPSERLSPYEVSSKNGNGGDWRDVVAAMHRVRDPRRNPATRPETGREPVKQTEKEIER
jgi:hypothetical protein